MSYYHENVVWQTKTGDWYIGFFTRISTGGYSDEDYDSEWDDDFDYDSFEWASGPHRTVGEAVASYPGGNPGGHSEVAYTDENKGRMEKYDKLYAEYVKYHPPRPAVNGFGFYRF